MKFECDQTLTSEALQRVLPVVAQKTTNPIVTNLRIEAKDDALWLQALNLEHSLEYRLEGVAVAEPGVLCLPARQLGEIFRLLPKGPVSVKANKHHGAVIKGAGSSFTINGADPAEFPTLPVFDENESFPLPADTLREMVNLVSFAVTKKKMRYALHGVLFEVKANALTLVGTDGQRMAVAKRELEVGKNLASNIIVQPEGLKHLERALTDEDETIAIQVKENQILVKTIHGVFSTLLVEGVFPDYQSVIPDNEGAQKAVLDRLDWIANLKRAKVLVSEETQTVRLAFADNKLVISSQDPEAGESTHEMEIDYTGEAIEIGFDPMYLLDVLGILTDPEIVFELQGPDAAGVIRQGNEFTYVVMPTEIA